MEVLTLINLLVVQGCLVCSFTTAQGNNNSNSENCIVDLKTLTFWNSNTGNEANRTSFLRDIGILEIIIVLKIRANRSSGPRRDASSENNTRCTFDVGQLLKDVPEDEECMLHTTFSCLKNSKIQLVLENPSGIQNKKVIGFLFSSRCSLSWEDAAVYGHIVDLKVLFFLYMQYEEEERLLRPESRKPYDKGLQNIVSVGFLTNHRNSEHLSGKVSQNNQPLYSSSNLGRFYIPPWKGIKGIKVTGSWSRIVEDQNPRSTDRYSNSFGIKYYCFMDMKNNNITDLRHFHFMGFIQQISLKSNGLKHVGLNTFRRIERLMNLDLSRNKLETLPEKVFFGLNYLRDLNVEQNMLSSIGTMTFSGLTSLQTLSLSDNKLTIIRAGSFRHLKSLQTFRVASNHLTRVDEDVFVKASQLSTVDFAQNKLTFIPKWLFLIRSLVNIDTSGNRVTFDSLHRLVSSIDVISLRDVHPNTVQTPRKARVSLRRNNITTMPTQAFSHNDNITFSTLLSFFHFDVRGNPIKCDCHSFPFYQYLDKVSQKKNLHPRDSIRSWKCDSPNSVKGLSIVDVPATTFRCSQNFTDCPARCTCYQRSVDQVVEVDCRRQKLTQIPEKVPEGTEVLYLDRNWISKIKTRHPYFSTLRSLTLSHNNVSKLSHPVVESFTNLSHLKLHNNRLQYLPKALADLNLKAISLRNNPLVCDCRSKWIKYWLLSKRHAINDIEDIFCTSGKAQGKHYVEARDGEFVCEISTEGKVAISLAVFIVVITVVVCVIHRFRGEIKLFLYVHFNWHPFDKSDDQDCNKLYDAFVSYSGIDYRWVCHTLRKNIELRVPPYRLCLHDRDFMPGYPIQENIKNAIDKSRRMIVILSKNYIQSDWCLYEFRAAHHKVMKERCNFLIVIKCSDVSMNDLDEDLQLYLRTNTYLDVINKWFWEKLFYTLPQSPLSILKRSDQQEPEDHSTFPLFVPASLPPVRVQQEPFSAECTGILPSHTLGEQQPSLSQTRCPSGQPSVVLVSSQKTGDETSRSTAYIPYQMDLCTPWPANNFLQAEGVATLCQANGYIPFPGGSFLPDENPPVGYQDSDSESEDCGKDNDEVHINVDGDEGTRASVRLPATGNNTPNMGVSVLHNVKEEKIHLRSVSPSTSSPHRDQKTPDSAIPVTFDVTSV